MFVGEVKNFKVYLARYVDDGLVICKSQDAINAVLSYLQNNFQITVNEANEFVGMESSVIDQTVQLRLANLII